MLLILFAVAVIVLALLITLPTAKNAGIASVVAFVILALAGAVGAVIFTQHYHLPASEEEKAEHSREIIVDWFKEDGVEVTEAPDAEELIDGGFRSWTIKVPAQESVDPQTGQPVMGEEQEVSILCSPVTDFPEKAALDCLSPQAINQAGDHEKKVDFSHLGGGH